jgi:chaperonin GroES
MIELRAVGHRVIVKPDPIETKTAGGIILKINEKMERSASQKGTVLMVGPMAWKNEVYGFGLEGWTPWCKAGDRVFFAKYAGKFIDVTDEETVIVLNDEDIQAVIEKE